MKPYKMSEKDMTKGICWKYALACMLNVKPSKVPSFLDEDSSNMEDRTRVWLQKKHKKSLVYLPINLFFESTDENRFNARGGPEGFSIMLLETTDENVNHVVIAKDGKYFFNPCDNDFREFTTPLGFYIVYDL